MGSGKEQRYLPEVSCPSGQRQSPQGDRWPGGEDGELCALAARPPGRGPLRATGANVSSANTCLQIGARGAGSGLSGWHRKAYFLSEQTSVLGGDVPGRVNLACLYIGDYPFPSDAGGRPHPISHGLKPPQHLMTADAASCSVHPAGLVRSPRPSLFKSEPRGWGSWGSCACWPHSGCGRDHRSDT